MEQVQRPEVSQPTDPSYLHRAARLRLALGDAELALESSNNAVHQVEVYSADYSVEQCYLTHARILCALGRGAEADRYLQRAYERVMLVASKTQDERLRQSWLENVPDNREIVAEWEARHKGA
jgi:hypothetical protein